MKKTTGKAGSARGRRRCIMCGGTKRLQFIGGSVKKCFFCDANGYELPAAAEKRQVRAFLKKG